MSNNFYKYLEKKYKVILLIIVVLGAGLRLIDTHKKLIWQDEAETVINSIQVIEDGYPHGYFKGKKIFESKLRIEIDDPVYAYTESNFYGSKYENNKGWLGYYYLAPFVKIFGVSELSVRLPFLLFYILTTILIFRLSQIFFDNKIISLLACFLFAIDPVSILYGKQARYYSIIMLMAPALLYFNYLYTKNKRIIYLWLLTTSLILTFHTHILLCSFIILFLIYYNFLKTKTIKLDKYIVYNLGYFLLCTVPWLILVKFWTNFETHGIASSDLNFIPILWIIGVLLYLALYRVYKFITKDKKYLHINEIIPSYLLHFFCGYLIIFPILIPAESFSDRIFISLLPLFTIIISRLIYKIFIKKRTKLTITLIFLLSIYLVLMFGLRAQMFYGKNSWINSVIRYAQETNLKNDDLLITNWHDLTLSLYTDYNIYPLYTLNPDFVNNYPNRVLAIMSLKAMIPNGTTNKPRIHENLILEEARFYNFSDRLKNCKKVYIDQYTLIFDCPKLENYEK